MKVTEDWLRKIVKESIETFLSENRIGIKDIDIKAIPIDVLKKAYKDFRLIPTSTYYGDVLHSPTTIKEAVGDILPPDEVVEKICQKYQLPKEMVVKVEHHHNIYVYAIIAVVGKNDKMIESDMSKMGYFMTTKSDTETVNGMTFQILQFEPSSQIQDDITKEVLQENNVLYHWTPSYNLESILKKGLIPSHQNSRFKYPPRTYLIEEKASDKDIYNLGQSLCMMNENPNNNGKYVLLSVSTRQLPESVRFYYDANSAIGVYTEQQIPKECLNITQEMQFPKIMRG